MSGWWIVGIAAVLLAEAALAWHCVRHHRHDDRTQGAIGGSQ